MRDLTLNRAVSSRVLAVHLVFKPHGWTIFYIDDERGALAVESEWGSWAHRWGRGSHLDESHDLSAALKGRIGNDPDYIARKLFGSNVREYDPEATRKAWRQRVLEQRRNGRVTRDVAREAWRQAGDVDLEVIERAYDALDDLPELDGVLGERCEVFERTERREFLVMRDVVIPALLTHLRGDAAPEARAAP